MRIFSGLARAALLTSCLLLALAFADVDAAQAHGGRVKPKPPTPGDGTDPGRPTPKPTPKDMPPKRPSPTTPPGAPTTPPPTPPPTPGEPTTPEPEIGPKKPATGISGGFVKGRPRSGTSNVGAMWQTWWELNRWRFFPERGSVRKHVGAVVTPAGEVGKDKIDERVLAERRRALVARQHIVPFLLRMLEPKRRVRDEVRSASLLALAKIARDEEVFRILLRYAEAPKESDLVRESAALAVGLMRRTQKELQFEGGRLDIARKHLLQLIENEKAHDRTRSFAALAIGLLGDQPYGSAFSKDGRVTTRQLWQLLGEKYRSSEVPIALMTAIGMQPALGTGDEIKKGLQRIALGRRVLRKTWDPNERSHALNALVRQQGAGWEIALLRTITAKRLPPAIRRSAFIALGAHATDLSPADRLNATDAAMTGVRYGRDSLTRGMGQIAIGRLLGADLRAGSAVVLDRTESAEYLIGEARKGPRPVRGFAALAVALAARDVNAIDTSALKFRSSARATLLQGFERTGDAMLKGAYAVGMGLCCEAKGPGVEALTTTLADRGAGPSVRGHAAVALAQLGVRSAPVMRALRMALWDKRAVELRSEAALAMSFLGGRSETAMLVQELRNAKSQWVLAQISAALGQLGDLEAVPAVTEVADDDRRGEQARGLAIASLGLLTDPERKPSILRLTFDTNYPARTDALAEVYTIL